MHNSMRVCVVKRFEKFIGIKLNVQLVKLMNQLLGLNIWYVLENQAWCFCCLIPYHV